MQLPLVFLHSKENDKMFIIHLKVDFLLKFVYTSPGASTSKKSIKALYFVLLSTLFLVLRKERGSVFAERQEA
jgi:hypothetical protein